MTSNDSQQFTINENELKFYLYGLDNKIDKGIGVLNTKIEAIDTRISDFQHSMDNRINDLQTSVYWGFALIGLFIAIVAIIASCAPAIAHFFRNLRSNAFTPEQTEQLKELIRATMAESNSAITNR